MCCFTVVCVFVVVWCWLLFMYFVTELSSFWMMLCHLLLLGVDMVFTECIGVLCIAKIITRHQSLMITILYLVWLMNNWLALYRCWVVIYTAVVLMIRALKTISQMWIVLLSLIEHRVHHLIVWLFWWNWIIRLHSLCLIYVQLCLILLRQLLVSRSIMWRLNKLRVASKLISTIWTTMLSSLSLIAHCWFSWLLRCSSRIWSRIISTLAHYESILWESLHIDLMMNSTNNLIYSALSFHLNLC